MKRLSVRNPILTLASFAILAATAGACGELTGPESPTTPTDVVATLASPTSVVVTWTPSPLNDGVINYIIYRNGTRVGESVGTATTFTDTGLSPQTTYVYSVASNCLGGVESARSIETEASTVTTIDVTPPTVTPVSPPAGSADVSPSADVNAQFSEPMDPATINGTTFTVRVTNGAAIAGTVSYDPATRRARFLPAGDLSPNPGSFTATITTGAKDLAGNSLAQAVSWTFTTRDITPPTVIETSPANGATGVSLNTAVTITFSENMDASTINASNITLRVTGAGTILTSVVTYNTATRVATLTPSGPLAQSVNYTVTVSNAVKDVIGNAIAPFTFAFTTGDVTAPTVLSTIPADNATGVALGSTVSATFSEPMNPATITTATFTVRPTAGGGNLSGTVAYNAGTNTATFTPGSPLAGGTSYTATITTGVRDAAGNPMAAAKTWSFVTIDVIPPTVLTVVPADGAAAVPVNSVVRITFSEPMDASTINATNLRVTNVATSGVVPATVTYDAPTRVASITPTGALSNSTNYRVTVTTDVSDVSGNELASQFVSTFTTAAAADVTPPTIVSRNPLNGATGVAINSDVTVTFSEPMDAASITTATFTLVPTVAGPPAVPAAVSYIPASNQAVLNPTSDLLNNTSYTVAVTTGVKDIAGNAVVAAAGQPLVTTFTTATDTSPPTVTATSPVAGATNVARNTLVTVTFSEPMDAATITGTTFTVTAGGAVIGGITYNATTRVATFTPSAQLAANTLHTVTITTGVEDVAGNNMAVNASFSFTTGP